jgi:hypothetical protein
MKPENAKQGKAKQSKDAQTTSEEARYPTRVIIKVEKWTTIEAVGFPSRQRINSALNRRHRA